MSLEIPLFVSGFFVNAYSVVGISMEWVSLSKREVAVCSWLHVISLADFYGKKMVIVIPGLLESETCVLRYHSGFFDVGGVGGIPVECREQ